MNTRIQSLDLDIPGQETLTVKDFIAKYGKSEQVKGLSSHQFVRVQYENKWSYNLTHKAHPVKIIYSGRGGGKSWAIARALLRMMDWGHNNRFGHPIRVAALRETKESITESTRYNISQQIDYLGLSHKFTVTSKRITHANGSELFYTGLSDTTAASIKSLEGVDIAWFDEAHDMSEYGWTTFQPTIRKPGSEIWLSFNPQNIFDVVWRLVQNPEPTWFVFKTGWQQNEFFTEANNRQRLHDKAVNPHLYEWVWEGIPNESTEGLRIIPYRLGMKCRDAWDLRPKNLGMWEYGLDVADKGVDFYGFVGRRGPCLSYADRQQFITQGTAVQYYHNHIKEKPVHSLRYDETGVGAGVRSEYHNIGSRTYQVIAEGFGNKVKGGGTYFTPSTKNRDFFSKRNAQMGWGLRVRANRTEKLLQGEKVDKRKCLFINPHIPCVNELLIQLSQPLYVHEDGKMKVHKRAEMKPDGTLKLKALKSPDLYDATVLAFGGDSSYGLIA